MRGGVVMIIKELLSKKLNGLHVKLFEYDIHDEQNFNKLKEYLINKVKKSKVHDVENYNLNFFGSKNLNPEFIKKFNEQISKINNPLVAKIPQFDVRRERITGWMAQLLLEKQYNCKFYDEADKRLNIEPKDIDKQIPGIDVPGIRIVNEQLKFVVCEVKASEDENIPCSSVRDLQKDIQGSIDNQKRISREILQYMHGIRNVRLGDNELLRIIDFLSRLIVNSNNELINNIFFFPVLIRNNISIVKNKDVSDYKNFLVTGIDKNNIENIVYAFNYSINDFYKDIYEEAIGNGKY